MKLSKPQLSWLLYDMASSAFALNVRTVFAPLYFMFCASAMEPAIATGRWGLVTSGAGILAGILAPWLGASADAKTTRKKWLMIFTLLGIAGTIALACFGKGQAGAVLGCFFVAQVAYMACNSFYDSLLLSVSPRGSIHRLSALGCGLGYLGGMIPFLLTLVPVLVLKEKITPMRLALVFAAIWWGIGAIPLFRNVREKKTSTEFRDEPFAGLKQLWRTAKEIRNYRNVLLFLVAYFLYIDGVGTILLMATPLSEEIGIPSSWLLLTILGLQVLGLPFSLLYGKLSNYLHPRKLVWCAIGVYVLIAFLIGCLPFCDSFPVKAGVFFAVAFLIGTSQGGIQALSRSLYSTLIPRGKESEFFGIYNIFGKYTTVLGPVVIWITGMIWKHSEFGLASLIVPFCCGALLLGKVKFPK